MNTNSYFTIETLTTGTVIIQLTNATGSETPGTIYYWINSEPNASRSNYTGSIIPSGTAQYIRINNVDPPVGTVIKFYRAETTGLCFGDGGDNGSYIRIFGTAERKVYGNIASLIGFSETLPNACFRYLFYNTNIVDASELELPWTTLSQYCFIRMFYSNTKLVKTPYLPATTLAQYCYTYMFRGCSALKTIADMGVQTITCKDAFNEMYALTGIETVTIPKMHFNSGRMNGFMRNCTSLKQAVVETYDETLPNNVYQHLFRGCTGLEKITCKAKSFNTSTFTDWLLDASATGTFIKDKDTTWSTGNSGIPEGWTIKNINQYTQLLDLNGVISVKYRGVNNIIKIYGQNNVLIWENKNHDYSKDYFSMKSAVSTGSAITIQNSGTTYNTFYYRVDGGSWTAVTFSSSMTRKYLEFASSATVEFCSTATTWQGYNWRFDSDVNIWGNLGSLLKGTTTEVMTEDLVSIPDNCFNSFFMDGGINDGSNLILPDAPYIGVNCFKWLFLSNSQMTKGPKELPYRNLNTSCYEGMYEECSKLTESPVLPALNLTSNCYKYMFYGCSALNKIEAYFLDDPTDGSYTSNWVNSVAASGTFIKNSSATWTTTGNNGVPTGWTAQTNAAPEIPYEYQYFTIEATGSGNITLKTYGSSSYLNDVYIYYSINGNTWKSYRPRSSSSKTIGSLVAGDKVRFACTSTGFSNNYSGSYVYFGGTATHKIYGNFGSLLRGTTDTPISSALPSSITQYAFQQMFKSDANLTDASNLYFPVMNLSARCFYYMFNECTGLVTGPTILPVKDLAEECYNGMFSGCTNLTKAPILPAITLVSNCYVYMFNNCNNLVWIKAMFTTTPNSNYTSNWVTNVASSGTFIKNSAATWDYRGTSSVPNNWTIETASS